MVEDKIRLQSRETDKYYEQIIEEMKQLEEKKSEEALQRVQKNTIRGTIRMKEMKHEGCKEKLEKDEDRGGHTELSHLESCRSSAVDKSEEMISPESPR